MSILIPFSLSSLSSALSPPLSPSIWPRAASWWRPSAHPSSLTWNSTSKSPHACKAFTHPQMHKQSLKVCLQQSLPVLSSSESPAYPQYCTVCPVCCIIRTGCRLNVYLSSFDTFGSNGLHFCNISRWLSKHLE